MATSEVSFDLSIFEQSLTSMKSCSEKAEECIVTKRILTALLYYSRLDTTDNMNDRSIFINFMDTIYKHQVYDDKFHFIKFHQDDIESVVRLATTSYSYKPCDLAICTYSDRHFRVNQQAAHNKSISNCNDDAMKYFNVYTEIMDSFHFYLFHLTDGGLRGSRHDTNESENAVEKQSSPGFDPIFSRLRDNIWASKTKTDRFTRLGGNKYNLSVNDSRDKSSTEVDIENKNAEKNEEANNEKSPQMFDQTLSSSNKTKNEGVIIKKTKGKTYLDALYKRISSKSTQNKQLVSKLKQLIKSSDYDTESVDMDLNIFKECGICNISLQLNDEQKLIAEMIKYFDESRSFDIKYVHYVLHQCLFNMNKQRMKVHSVLEFHGNIKEKKRVNIRSKQNIRI